MSSSRVFLDKEIKPIQEYLNWLIVNPEIGKRVNADEVTKVEAMTIGQIHAYVKPEDAKEATFHSVATVDDVVGDRPWYYIACSGCQTKATKGPSTLMCADVTGAAKYLAKISVYENNDQAVFVLLGDAGTELAGKPAAELVDKYSEANKELGSGHQMHVPQVLIDTIGQTHKFKIKVYELNLTRKIQALNVIKVVSSDVLPPLSSSAEIPINVEDEAALSTASANDVSGSYDGDGSESMGSIEEAHKAKRPKLGI